MLRCVTYFILIHKNALLYALQKINIFFRIFGNSFLCKYSRCTISANSGYRAYTTFSTFLNKPPWSVKGIQGTFVNRALPSLHGGPLLFKILIDREEFSLISIFNDTKAIFSLKIQGLGYLKIIENVISLTNKKSTK